MAVASKAAFASPVSIVEFDIHVEDPIQHLLLCHQKIERCLNIVLSAVKSLRSTEPVLRAEAAAALDYELALLQVLSVAHTQDEEKSLFPRLRANVSNDPLAMKELLGTLESQHRDKDALFTEIAICLAKISGRPGPDTEEQLIQLEGLASALANLYRPHITLENERLIPNCAGILKPPDLDAMRLEMQARFDG